MDRGSTKTEITERTWPTVLIAGAGPTGLTLACELARSGVSFRLIEAAPGPQPGSRGKGIQPRTLEVFERSRDRRPRDRQRPDGDADGSGSPPTAS